MNGIIQCVAFFVSSLFHLHVLRFIHVVARISTSFLLMSEYSFGYTTFCSSVDGHLGCFCLLATVDNVAVNKGV